jgi:hypothetical protein
LDHSSSARIAADRRQPLAGRYPPGARITLRETAAGAWIVRDEEDRHGGRFVTRKDAMRYIRTQFGPDAEIVVLGASQKEAA